MDEMSLYDLDEDGSYYDDDYNDLIDEDDYYRMWGLRYRWRNFRYKLSAFIRWHFKRCKACGNLTKDCQCLPF